MNQVCVTTEPLIKSLPLRMQDAMSPWLVCFMFQLHSHRQMHWSKIKPPDFLHSLCSHVSDACTRRIPHRAFNEQKNILGCSQKTGYQMTSEKALTHKPWKLPPQGQHSCPPLKPMLPHSLWTTYGHSCSIKPISLKYTSPQVWKRFYWEVETTQNHIIKEHLKNFWSLQN